MTLSDPRQTSVSSLQKLEKALLFELFRSILSPAEKRPYGKD